MHDAIRLTCLIAVDEKHLKTANSNFIWQNFIEMHKRKFGA